VRESERERERVIERKRQGAKCDEAKCDKTKCDQEKRDKANCD
jgi:hypothetical protein